MSSQVSRQCAADFSYDDVLAFISKRKAEEAAPVHNLIEVPTLKEVDFSDPLDKKKAFLSTDRGMRALGNLHTCFQQGLYVNYRHFGMKVEQVVQDLHSSSDLGIAQVRSALIHSFSDPLCQNELKSYYSEEGMSVTAVSYTHLTLPTICSV